MIVSVKKTSRRLILLLIFCLNVFQLSAEQGFLILLTSNDCINCQNYPNLLREKLKKSNITNYRILLDGSKALESYVAEKYNLKSQYTNSKRKFNKYFSGKGKSRFMLVSEGEILYDEILSIALDESKVWLELYWNRLTPQLRHLKSVTWKDKDLTKYVKSRPYEFGENIILHNSFFNRFSVYSLESEDFRDVLADWSVDLMLESPLKEQDIKSVEIEQDAIYLLCSSTKYPRDSLLLISADTNFNMVRNHYLPVEFYKDEVRYRLGAYTAVGSVFSIFNDSLMMIKVYNANVLPGEEKFNDYAYLPNAALFNYKKKTNHFVRFVSGELPKNRLLSGRGYFNHDLVFESTGSEGYAFLDGEPFVDTTCSEGYVCRLTSYAKMSESSYFYVISNERKNKHSYTLTSSNTKKVRIKRSPNQSVFLTGQDYIYSLSYHYLRKKVRLDVYEVIH
jgi:hypothetical protein